MVTIVIRGSSEMRVGARPSNTTIAFQFGFSMRFNELSVWTKVGRPIDGMMKVMCGTSVLENPSRSLVKVEYESRVAYMLIVKSEKN